MIEVGVQTKGLIPEKPLEVGIKMISDAGFTRVDYNLDTYLKNIAIYSGNINQFFDEPLENLMTYFSNQRDVMKKNGISPSQMHAPYPFFVYGKDNQNQYMREVVVPKSIAIASAMNVSWMVLHPAKMQYTFGKDEEMKVNLEFFASLILLLKKYGVGICVENLYEGVGGRITEGVCSNPEEAVAYVDVLNEYAGEELFGICLDTGHLQLTKRDAAEYISKVGDRLKILHLHENDAIGDLHQMPYTFGGERYDGLDWSKIAKALADIDFDGTLSFETFPCMNSFMQGMEADVLATIYAIGDDLRNQINEFKGNS